VIGCANTLVEADWEVRALREQREAIETQRSRVKTAQAPSAMKVLPAGESI
jgi:hypothetical protein